MKKMKEALIGVIAAALMLANGGSAASDEDAEEAFWEYCIDDECSMIWIEPEEPKVSLEGEPCDYCEESEDEKGGGSPLDTVEYDGDCYYIDTPDDEAVVCDIDFPSGLGNYYYVAVGKHPTLDRIKMCYYNTSTSAWEEAGWCDFGDAYQLIVDGQDIGESIQIVRYSTSDANCPLDDFTNRFDYTVSSSRELQIRGNGGTDYVYGSNFSDSSLAGERVYGREGDDIIYLDNDGVTNPYGYGGPDCDEINGTSSADYVWGDDVGSNDGDDDEIYGEGGMDLLVGVYGDDTVEGGSNADYLWGGDDDDTLVPGLGTDVCYGGSGSDTCTGCESVPSSDCTS